MVRKKLTKGHIAIVTILILLAVICFYPMWYTPVSYTHLWMASSRTDSRFLHIWRATCPISS